MKGNIVYVPILILLCIAIFCIPSCAFNEEDVIETRDVKSCVLESGNSEESSGLFVLGIGVYSSGKYISTDYYMYIKGTEGFRLQKINSECLEIVETDDVDPCIKGNFYSDGKVKSYESYVIYLPIGTIKQEYSANITE